MNKSSNNNNNHNGTNDMIKEIFDNQSTPIRKKSANNEKSVNTCLELSNDQIK